MPVNLRVLRYVVAVADEGTFQRAAERLHMAQPPLSRQIGGLERELGVVLFERNPTRPTAAGAAFVARARRVLAAADQLVRDVTAAPGPPVLGDVRLGYLPATGLDTIPVLADAVRRRHPGIALDAFDKWS